MNEKAIEEKLRKNARRVTGIAALRKIRVMVDDLDGHACKNKKRLIAVLAISILILLWFVGSVFNREPNYQSINTSQYDFEKVDVEYVTESKSRLRTKDKTWH